MKKLFLSFLISILFINFCTVNAQKVTNNVSVKGATYEYYKPGVSIPTIIKIDTKHSFNITDLNDWLNTELNLNPANYSTELVSNKVEENGMGHYRYQQLYKNIPIKGAVFVVHTRNNKAILINGEIYNNVNIDMPKNDLKENARNKALSYMNADIYKWEIPQEESKIKSIKSNEDASYFPKGKLVILPINNGKETTHQLSYEFNIYAHLPLKRELVYIDAHAEQVIQSVNLLNYADTSGTAKTGYSGERKINFEQKNDSTYILKDNTRGKGIITYDVNNGTSYSSALNFQSDSVYWNLDNDYLDQYALDAHWGAEITYDYFLQKHGINSIDNNGYQLRNYVHFSLKSAGQPDNVNAFWDGEVMTYGDGDASRDITPITALDLIGHEITHGLTNFTANLMYQNESGALSESMSDIFGTVIEHFGTPEDANWTFGEKHGITWRSLSDPKSYSLPDTYKGTHWYSGSLDAGGVHTNSSVFNYWFYLVSEGGNGTNDNNIDYSVTGIGMDKAAEIAFRMLTIYMTPNTGLYEAGQIALLATNDLYSGCGDEVKAVANANIAIGLSDSIDFAAQADFSANINEFCEAPVNIVFSNYTQFADDFYWDFGDGSTSTEKEPIHKYENTGTYSVQLIATSGSCGSDTIKYENIVNINEANSCELTMPLNATNSFAGCGYTLKDNGGDSNYTRNNAGIFTISTNNPTEGIRLDFSTFDFPSTGDALFIYDGPSTNSPLIGKYIGKELPERGTVFSTSSSITLKQDTYGTSGQGFELTWSCTNLDLVPEAIMVVESDVTCDGEVQFTDASTNNPISWIWDFGDGNYSQEQNPTHTYNSLGSYNVTLIVENENGKGMVTNENFILSETYPTASFYYIKDEKHVEFTNNSEHASSYYWDFGDGNFSEEESPVHDYAKTGLYLVTLTSTNKCGEVTTTPKNLDIVGMYSNSNPLINIYPNPSKDHIIIEGAANATIEIYNMLGKLLLNTNAESNMQQLNINNINENVLLIKINHKDYSHSQKLLRINN